MEEHAPTEGMDTFATAQVLGIRVQSVELTSTNVKQQLCFTTASKDRATAPTLWGVLRVTACPDSEDEDVKLTLTNAHPTLASTEGGALTK